MRGINFLAGLGTILAFIGFYCFRAVFSKRQTGHGASRPGSLLNRPAGKLYLFLIGLICVLSGILLILKAMKLV